MGSLSAGRLRRSLGFVRAQRHERRRQPDGHTAGLGLGTEVVEDGIPLEVVVVPIKELVDRTGVSFR